MRNAKPVHIRVAPTAIGTGLRTCSAPAAGPMGQKSTAPSMHKWTTITDIYVNDWLVYG
jgi:hypothetical protein